MASLPLDNEGKVDTVSSVEVYQQASSSDQIRHPNLRLENSPQAYSTTAEKMRSTDKIRLQLDL